MGRLLGTIGVLFVIVIASSVDAKTVPVRNLTPSGLRVSGNSLLIGNGPSIQVRGVDRSGTEYLCVRGFGIFDGPSDAASVAAIASWRVNVGRVPFNGDCWLGVNGIKGAYSGARYRAAIVAYASLLHRYGMYAELSLMWRAPGSYGATRQPMAPDESHFPAMWTSMANTFRRDRNVILAAWGEPTIGWTCFMRTGCNDEATFGPQKTPYQTASMQQAVDLMRAPDTRV